MQEQQKPLQQPVVDQQQRLEQMEQQKRQKTSLGGGERRQEEEKEQGTETDFSLREHFQLAVKPSEKTARRTPRVVTRVVGDLMIFVGVSDGDTPQVGLVFKPDKIVDYRGERLKDLGIKPGQIVSEIHWDAATFKVSAVVLRQSTGFTPMSAAG